jgi:hypothetical protein
MKWDGRHVVTLFEKQDFEQTTEKTENKLSQKRQGIN